MDTYIQVEDVTGVQADIGLLIKDGHDVLNDYFDYLKQTTSFPYTSHDDWQILRGQGMYCPGALGAVERACRSYSAGEKIDFGDLEAKLKEAKGQMTNLQFTLESDEW